MPRAREAWKAAVLAAVCGGLPLAAQQTIGGCSLYPASNVWNVPVASLPVAANSSTLIGNMNPGHGLHADFGAGLYDGGEIGIPYVVVAADQPLVDVDFDTLGWSDESDAGGYPFPADPPIEGEPGNATGDRHVLILRQGECKLYETYYTYANGDSAQAYNDFYPAVRTCPTPNAATPWCAASGAIFALTSNALRPDGWTSADAAGLPMLPGLVDYPEVATGEIRHAVRFTVNTTRKSYLWPARHHAGSTTSTSYPPMGLRVRLKAGVDLSGFSPEVRTILTAFKRYGLILADNGSDWFVSGAPHAGWNNDDLQALGQIHGSDFEVVDVSSLELDPDSGATPHLFSDGFERGSGSFATWSDASTGAP